MVIHNRRPGAPDRFVVLEIPARQGLVSNRAVIPQRARTDEGVLIFPIDRQIARRDVM
jgi:hypothetical protein